MGPKLQKHFHGFKNKFIKIKNDTTILNLFFHLINRS